MAAPREPIGGSDPAGVEQAFFEAWTSNADPDSSVIELMPDRLARAVTIALGADGAGLSGFTRNVRIPLGASSDAATTAERLQFTLGEGPCLAALAAGHAVVCDEKDILQRWPSTHSYLTAHTPYRSVVSLPLNVAGRVGGALDLYLRGPSQAQAVDLTDAATVADCACAVLTANAATDTPDHPGPNWLHGPTPTRRMMVWTAIGMLNVRLQLTAADALARLRAYAYAHDLNLDDLADSLVKGQSLDLDELAL
jgi:hypothetical protein